MGKIDKSLGALFGGRKSNRALNQEIFAMYPNAAAKRPMGGMIPYMAGGGGVGYAAGVDTVPAMLSGGEFVMNAAATSRIGASNLQALNSGASMGGGSTSITKGDTNINIVVNSNGSVNQNASADAGAHASTAKRARVRGLGPHDASALPWQVEDQLLGNPSRIARKPPTPCEAHGLGADAPAGAVGR